MTSFQEAEDRCADQGARLLQPRSDSMLASLALLEKAHLVKADGGEGHFSEDVFGESVTAIGLKYEMITDMNDENATSQYQLKYRQVCP